MTSLPTPISAPTLPRDSAQGVAAFALACLTLLLAAALLASGMPLGFSILTVFLFAGPHNWAEARYFLSRMPAHWGPLRNFFRIAIAGVVGLSALFILLPLIGRHFHWNLDAWRASISAWDSLFLLWIAWLVQTHFATRRPLLAGAAMPIALLGVAFCWASPNSFDVMLVYLHPLVALWFLDRELGRRRPQWRAAYRGILCCVPLCVLAIAWRLADAPPLPGDDALTLRITSHAGADFLRAFPPRTLVATHVFLEVLHYAVWLVAIPLLTVGLSPWRLPSAPLVRRSPRFRTAIIALLALGAVVVLVLWGSFLADYPLTRDVYFTLAIAHVLAEVPFLLRTY